MNNKILVAVVILVFGIYSSVFSNSVNDTYFYLRNPINGNSLIVSRDGKKILSGIKNESRVNLIRDMFTGEPTYIVKIFLSREEIDAGPNGHYINYIATGSSIYDFELNVLFNTGACDRIDSVENKIIFCYNKKVSIFDTKDKQIKEYDYEQYSLLGNNIVFYNYDSDEIDTLEVYDKNLNLVKSIKGYTVLSECTFDNEKYLVLKTSSYLYNYLDKDCNILFYKDVECIGMPDSTKETKKKFLCEGKVFLYDMLKKVYISTDSQLTYEENNIYNDIENNIKKIKDLAGNPEEIYAYVRSFEHNGKRIYLSILHEPADRFKNGEVALWKKTYLNIYDASLHLLAKGLKLSSDSQTPLEEPLKYGWIVIDDKVYDFEMKYVRTIKSQTKYLETIQIDDKVYFLDGRSDNGQNLYDVRFKIIFENCESIDMTTDCNWVFITDNNSTKIYDNKFKLIKDFNRKVEHKHGHYVNNYCEFRDVETKKYGVINKKGNIVVDDLEEIISLKSDYFVFHNDLRYGIMDYNNNIIVSLSINDDN